MSVNSPDIGWPNVAAPPCWLKNVQMHSVHPSGVGRLHHDLVDGRGAKQADLGGLKRDRDDVVLVAAEAAALAREDADDRERYVSNPDALSDRGLAAPQEVLNHGLAE